MKSTASLWLSLLLGLLIQLPMNASLSAMAKPKMTHKVSAPVAMPVAIPVTQTGNASSTPSVAMMNIAPASDPNIQTLESTLYATHYDGEPVESRLNRLETTVFGQPAQGNLPPGARIARLKSVLSQPVDITPLSPNNTAKAPSQNPNTAKTMPQAAPNTAMPQDDTAQAPAPGETDYPIVTEMEKRVFSKSFETEEISRRLARLEKETFKTQQNGALADRVDHLRSVVLGDGGNVLDPDRMAGNAPYSPPPSQWTPPNNYGRNATGGGGAFTYYSSSNSTNMGGDSSQTSSSSYSMQAPGNYGSGYSPQNRGIDDRTATPDMLSAMAEIEKQVIGHTFPSEPMNARLDRLETKVFNATSPEMPNEERMQRVIAVASAGGAPQSTQAKTRSAFQSILPIILTILPMVLL
jgi:hypothetical protein